MPQHTPAPTKKRQRNVGPCAVEGCDSPSRKRGWCSSHYSMWHTYGEIREWRHKWAEPNSLCAVCSTPVKPGTGRRKHCSAACQAAESRNPTRPDFATCDYCHRDFDLGRARTGRLQRTDTRWCPECRRDSPDVKRFLHYGVTREQYQAALKRGCEICLSVVDVLHVDHDHACCSGSKRTCGECVRGFLCGPCNRGIGLFFDNVEALTSAAAYLRRTSST